MKVVVRKDPKLFNGSVKLRSRDHKNLIEVISDFLRFKSVNPKQSYNPKDTPLTGGILKDLKLWHYDIGRSLRLYYNVSQEGDTVFLNLYGVFTHDETGTGQPANKRKQEKFVDHVKNAMNNKMSPLGNSLIERTVSFISSLIR